MTSGIRNVKVIARVKATSTTAQAQIELDTVQQAIVQEYPSFQFGREAKLRPLHEHLVANLRQTTLVLMGAVGFLWLLSCLNVGSFVLARTIARRTEIAIRMGLGATRMQVFSQLFAENSVLSLFGCALGLLIAYWAHGMLAAIIPQRVFGLDEFHIDTRILGFAIASFALTTLFVSLVAARVSSSLNLADALKAGASALSSSAGSRRMFKLLLVGEVALAVVLLVGAGLLIRSFWNLRYGDIVFPASKILTLRIDLTPSRYPDRANQAPFFENLVQRLGEVPGVDTAALCSSAPPIAVTSSFLVSVEGQPTPDTPSMARTQAVSPHYFRALQIPVVEGRIFSEEDREETTPVAIVNRAFVRRYLSQERVLGERIRLGGPLAPWRTIVGAVDDFKNIGLAAESEPEVYCPYPQYPFLGGMDVIVLASTADPLNLTPAIRHVVRELDREQPISEARTLDQRLTASVGQPRFAMSLLAGFAALGLLLAVVGIYAIMSYAGQQRVREIAIRMALGAEKRGVVWMLIREGITLSLAGCGIGLLAALAANRSISSLLYGVSSFDPYTFTIIPVLLVSAGVFACYFPAYRAARIDPIKTLRNE